ncbi:MAG: hypothetical protein K9L64_06820 [Candidatus Izimaplasma sp.]|nr:hypothetical protein [Candidatus Izimaplasma bacterium]
MKKKKRFFSVFIFDLSLILMLSMFLNVLNIEGLDRSVKGTELVFGSTEPLLTFMGYGISMSLDSSLLHFMVYFLPLILSIALVIISVTLRKLYIVKVLANFVMLLVFGFVIYFFFNLGSYSFNDTIFNVLNALGMELGFGAIVSIVVASFAFVFTLVNMAVELKNS